MKAATVFFCAVFFGLQEKQNPFWGAWQFSGFTIKGKYEEASRCGVWKLEKDGTGSDHFTRFKLFEPVKYFHYTATTDSFYIFKLNRTRSAFYDTVSWGYKFSADQDTLFLFAHNKNIVHLVFMPQSEFERKFKDEKKIQ